MSKTWAWLGPLSLAPLLGASQTLAHAFALLLASLFIVLTWRLCMAPLRHHLHESMHDLACLLVAAAMATCLEIALRAWSLPLYQALGLYPALLALNCLLLERADPSSLSMPSLARYGALLLVLGLVRELLSSGTLSLSVPTGGEQMGVRLATLAPGALILAGLLLAGVRAYHLRSCSNASAKETPKT